jgi:hypothetical protein
MQIFAIPRQVAPSFIQQDEGSNFHEWDRTEVRFRLERIESVPGSMTLFA